MGHASTVATVERLTAAITKATRSVRFSTSGTLPDIDPGLEVEGLGPVALPLEPSVARQLSAQCRVAPYGKGAKTLVNKRVRNTLELDPKKVRLGDAWDAAIERTTRQVAEQLEARLYKLLLYERGGSFCHIATARSSIVWSPA